MHTCEEVDKLRRELDSLNDESLELQDEIDELNYDLNRMELSIDSKTQLLLELERLLVYETVDYSCPECEYREAELIRESVAGLLWRCMGCGGYYEGPPPVSIRSRVNELQIWFSEVSFKIAAAWPAPHHEYCRSTLSIVEK